MVITTIAGGIVAIAKAIPAVRDIIIIANNRITKMQKNRISRKFTKKHDQVDKLMELIGSATTNEARREASKKLSALNSGRRK